VRGAVSSTYLVQPAAGQLGHTTRDLSSSATTVMTNVAYTAVEEFMTTRHSLQPSYMTMDGW
jgi:hypothetical protein